MSSDQRLLIPQDILVEAYSRNAGNKTRTAAELGVHRETVRKCLQQYGIADKPVFSGSSKILKHNVMALPTQGKVFRYLLTSAQNNTLVYKPFWNNLIAYKDWLNKDENTCQLMVARFSYNKNQYLNPKSQKPGGVKTSDEDECWYDESILPFICDDPKIHGTRRWQLAPDFFWCAEMNILPTAVRPLSDLKTYTGTESSAFPHAKVAMEAVASMPDTNTKHIYTTGTVTRRNYIERKAGFKANFHHTYAALLVEVDHLGNWWARQLVADSKGSFYDCPGGKVLKVVGGVVEPEGHRVEAINWGDVHVTDLPAWRHTYYWGKDGIIDILNPRYQFFHDTLSFRARTHHEMKSFSKMLEKHYTGNESVEVELERTTDFLTLSERAGTLSVVVRSNHDAHGEKWLDTADYKADLVNAELFLEAQLDRVRAIKRGDADDWMFFEWSAKKFGAPETIRFLKLDESFVICAKSGHPIECSLHGDIGPNGSRGSTANLSTLGCKVSKGHDHTATIRDGVYSAGTCAEQQGYNHGLTTWSVSHVLTYSNGKRCIVTERNQLLWAA